jgi:hypothetical protein
MAEKNASRTTRILRCIGDSCQVVRDSIPEIAGNLAVAGTSLATLDVSGAAKAVVGAKERRAQQMMLEDDVKSVETLIKQLQNTIKRIERRKYVICSMEHVKVTIARIKSRIDAYNKNDASTRAFRAGYPEYYRDHLSKDLLVLGAATNDLVLESNSIALNLLLVSNETNPAKRAKLMEELTSSCTRT